MIEALQKGAVMEAISILRTALKNLEEEGLEALSGEVYEGLTRIYWAIGDKKTAMQFARKTVEYRADFSPVLEPRNREEDLKAMIAGLD